MGSSLTPLEQARQDIDRIDDALHDLLMQRAELVGRIRAAKPQGQPAARPAREHMILKRLMQRHKGDLPRETVAAIWREIMGTFASLQGAGTVCGPAALAALARSHYGSAMRYAVEDEPGAVLARVSSGAAALGILPWPGEGQSWWVNAVEMQNRPAIVASLPFLAGGHPQAVALGMVDAEATGEDCTLLAYKARGEVPFAGVKPLAAKNGLRLIEVPEFVASNDRKITETKGLTWLGSFARPYRA